MSIPNQTEYVLGVDLGVNSLGAALIDTEGRRILWTGVRIFSAPFEGDYQSGREESRASHRRLARQQRRQTDRRRRRLISIFRTLQRGGLMPCGERADVLPSLDARLRAKFSADAVLPYLLRARALDCQLEPHELGRALYHLAQRRGFRGRVARESDEEEGGKIKADIEGLWKSMHDSGARTLGEYLAARPESERRRGYRTHRKMFEEEFEAIWTAQQTRDPILLTSDKKEALRRALFDQRPLKPADHLIGQCDLEPSEKRAPLWALETQNYRVLTAVNNLRISDRDGLRALSGDQRAILLEKLKFRDKMTFDQVRTALSLPKNVRFTIEEGGEKRVPGNLTSYRVFRALGEVWREMGEERRRELVRDLADPGSETDDELRQAISGKWQFSAEQCNELCGVSLPAGYASLSLKAIAKVTPSLEEGLTFAEAKRILWPEKFTRKEPLPYLPPVVGALGNEIRNPAVIRCLTEVRKVVNGVIRRYGKPGSIHIELAREMKRSRDERVKETARNREREKLRDEARRELAPHLGPNPARRDIEKYLLWKECKAQCPYSGEMISLSALFGEHPRFEVEHIIPFDRSLDDSFQNKTLCEAHKNAEKGKRTPREAFGHTEDWPAMADRVKDFRNPAKYRRFVMQEADRDKLLEEFTSRQLNDTKYASRLAAKYLGLLYGIERADNSSIVTCAGAVTAFLRREWNLNRILNDKPEKTRADHRHHAVDAIAIAMASMSQIKSLADAANRAAAERRRQFGSLADPWPGFRDQASKAILEDTMVSHRPKRQLAGELHDATFYGAVERNGKSCARYRKAVDRLSAGEIENISDPITRKIVSDAWLAAGKDSKRLADHWPLMRNKKGAIVHDRNGNPIPIKRVHCVKAHELVALAQGDRRRARHVISGGNHHMEVWEELDPKTGKVKKWRHRTVSRLEAAQRYKEWRLDHTIPIVRRDHGEGTNFCFSLSEGDTVMARRTQTEPETIWYVRTVRSRGAFELSPGTDARLKADQAGALWDVGLSTLIKLGGRKVTVTPMGDVIEAHD